MKVLWVGDSPRVSTGFARCTRAACDALVDAGHDVAVLGIGEPGDDDVGDDGWGSGRPTRYPVYRPANAYDSGRDRFGVTRLPVLADRLRPDVIVLLNDPWNVDGYTHYIGEFCAALRRRGLDDRAAAIEATPIVPWLAVDGKNVDGRPLNDVAHVMVWTDFAADELRAGGYEGDAAVVPLGVDHDVFRPRDRASARRRVLPDEVSEDAFVVGVVGRNQLRKRLDLTLDYFGEWLRRTGADDAYLYLHVAPTGDAGVDVRRVTRYHGLSRRLILAQQGVARGVDDGAMADVYAAMDVYATTTQGEGWGLPALEAMACGVPCVLPAWSGLESWARDAAVFVPCPTTALTAPVNSAPYTVGGVADREHFVAALSRLHDPDTRDAERERWRRAALERAARYDWRATGAGVVRELEAVVGGDVAVPGDVVGAVSRATVEEVA